MSDELKQVKQERLIGNSFNTVQPEYDQAVDKQHILDINADIAKAANERSEQAIQQLKEEMQNDKYSSRNQS